VTTLAHYRTSDAPLARTPQLPTLQRFTRKATTAVAVLADSLFFAQDMRSASTPAARREVLDRFAA